MIINGKTLGALLEGIRYHSSSEVKVGPNPVGLLEGPQNPDVLLSLANP